MKTARDLPAPEMAILDKLKIGVIGQVCVHKSRIGPLQELFAPWTFIDFEHRCQGMQRLTACSTHSGCFVFLIHP